MKRFFKIIFALCLLNFFSGYAQVFEEQKKEFTVKVQVINDNTQQPIKDATVTVNGRIFNFSNILIIILF